MRAHDPEPEFGQEQSSARARARVTARNCTKADDRPMTVSEKPSAPQFGDREPSSESASKAMQGNRSRDTKPEILLRKTLWHRGYRYRVHHDGLPGNPDIVFVGDRVAVFCDGDFWHGRNWDERRRKLEQGSNADYWVPKIQANRDRDARHTAELKNEGWKVIRIWEGKIKDDPESAADRVEVALRDRRSTE